VIALLSDRARPHPRADHDHRKRDVEGISLRGSSGHHLPVEVISVTAVGNRIRERPWSLPSSSTSGRGLTW